MQVTGQLLEQAPNNTIGYSEPSISANQWIARQFYAPLHTEGIGVARALDSFACLFDNVRLAPVYKFERLSRADELADLMECGLPTATDASAEYMLHDLALMTALGRSSKSDLGVADQVREIISWLGITHDELSQITGIGRSTLFYWQRNEGAPRAANARNINRLHALASLLVKRFGVKGAQSWIQNGPDRPWDYLIASDIASVEDLVRSTLFDQRGRNYAVRPTIGGEDLPPIAAPSKASLVRSSRRPRRGRLER
jgi:hypothetical protein